MNATAWREYALHLRAALDELGVELPSCMPDEVDECGHDTPHHALSYAAALQAKAEHAVWHLHHGDAHGQQAAQHLVQHWRREFHTAQCRDC